MDAPRYIPVYPARPVFYARCDRCQHSCNSDDLLAVVDTPWTYICQQCAAIERQQQENSDAR